MVTGWFGLRVVERWTGRLFLGTGWLVYVGPLGVTTMHRHHAFQLMLASCDVTVEHWGGGSVVGSRLLIGPDVHHRLASGAPDAVAFYLEPDLLRPAQLLRDPTPWVPPPGCLARLPVGAPSTWAETHLLVHEVMGALKAGEPVPSSPVIDAALLRITDLLPGPVRLPDVADAVHLSPSRLGHLLTAALGIPLRRYVLWQRLQLAARAVQSGADLTRAAHQAGFTDSSHMNRTFRAMFGLAPSDVLGVATWHLEDQVS